MHRLSAIRLARVEYVPRTLEHGVLYVAEQFGAAVHLCACGCGTKLSTPLRPTEWSLRDSPGGPTLTPSVGNWQRPCRSHYWIRSGEIIWAGEWSDEQVVAGRWAEVERRREYYDALEKKRGGLLRRFWRWVMGLFGR